MSDRNSRKALLARTAENMARFEAARAAITPADIETLARIYEEILGTADNGDSTGLREHWDWMIADAVWPLTAIHRLRAALDKCEDALRSATLNGRTRYEHDVLAEARLVLDLGVPRAASNHSGRGGE